LIRFRSYRNGDSPAIAALWSHHAPARNSVRLLSVHEYDGLVAGKLGFDRHGLVVAVDEDNVIGFAHAGFGPRELMGPSHALDTLMGTVAMLLVHPRDDAQAIAVALLEHTVAYLKGRGAQVVYAGGQHPLNPFFWGVYGGSEFAGILESHELFHAAAALQGFDPVATTVLFEASLSNPEPRDVRFVPVRRQFRVEIDEDSLMPSWWDALAIGQFHPTLLRLIDRQSGLCRASAWTWEIAPGMAAEDRLSRTAMFNLEVHPEFRRRGLGRMLVVECFRHARDQRGDILCAQTASTNIAALQLYQSLGFQMVEHATLYRLRGGA
jgi:ribosomal protein S18 acetylase RimI-like enzyme